jgi:hypothetical protein
LNEEKSKRAGLAQENGLAPAMFAQFAVRLVKCASNVFW